MSRTNLLAIAAACALGAACATALFTPPARAQLASPCDAPTTQICGDVSTRAAGLPFQRTIEVPRNVIGGGELLLDDIGGNLEIEQISISGRDLKPGERFWAFVRTNVDGHEVDHLIPPDVTYVAASGTVAHAVGTQHGMWRHQQGRAGTLVVGFKFGGSSAFVRINISGRVMD